MSRPRSCSRTGSYTLPQLDALADGLAASLRSRGVTAGERVALMASNRPEFVVALHAIWRLAAAVVLISPAWKRHEVEHALACDESVPRRRRPRSAVGTHADAAPRRTDPGRRTGVRRGRTGGGRCGVGVQLGYDGSAESGSPQPQVAAGRRAALARCAGFDRPRSNPDRHPAVAHPRSAQHHDGAADRCMAAPASPIRHRPHAGAHRSGSNHRRDGSCANRFGHGLAPAPGVLRPLVAAVHHVGRHAGQRKRRRDRHPSHRCRVGSRVRHHRAAGDRL